MKKEKKVVLIGCIGKHEKIKDCCGWEKEYGNLEILCGQYKHDENEREIRITIEEI